MRLCRPALAALALTGMTLASAHGRRGHVDVRPVPLRQGRENLWLQARAGPARSMRLSSLRIKGRCSASFVSPQGLVQTNHHCVTSCIRALSTQAQDLLASGFYAKEAKDERKCDGSRPRPAARDHGRDRTPQSRHAAKDGADVSDAVDEEKEAIIKECANGNAAIRCEVVELYGGALHNLYKFRTYRDVRLVLAPERAVGILRRRDRRFRVPALRLRCHLSARLCRRRAARHQRQLFALRQGRRRARRVIFVPGSPGWTDRYLTVAQLEFRRDVELPQRHYLQCGAARPADRIYRQRQKQARAAASLLGQVDRALRNDRRRLAALADPTIIKARAEFEKAVRAKDRRSIPTCRRSMASPGTRSRSRSTISAAGGSTISSPPAASGFRSDLFSYAQTLVRYAAETDKPEDERLNAFSERNLGATLKIRHRADRDRSRFREADLDLLVLGDARRARAPPSIRQEGPGQEVAARACGRARSRTRRLASCDVRNRLVEGGNGGDRRVERSDDRARARHRRGLARARKGLTRRRSWRFGEPIGRWWPRQYSRCTDTRSIPMPASRRASPSGRSRAIASAGRDIDPITTIGGLFEHATGTAPFKLPERWLAARGELNLAAAAQFRIDQRPDRRIFRFSRRQQGRRGRRRHVRHQCPGARRLFRLRSGGQSRRAASASAPCARRCPRSTRPTGSSRNSVGWVGAELIFQSARHCAPLPTSSGITSLSPPCAAVLLVTTLSTAHAAEGMWTFDDFPFEKVEQAYGFRPSQAWLDHVRLSSLRLSGGCSASFVSPHGLIQTNQHCVSACIEQLSTATRDFIATGFYAKDSERRAANVRKARSPTRRHHGRDRPRPQGDADKGDAFGEALKAAAASIEKECAAPTSGCAARWSSFTTAASTSLQISSLSRSAARVRARAVDCVVRRRSRQFRIPALQPRCRLSARLCRRQAARHPRRTICAMPRMDARPGDLTFMIGHPGSTYRLETVAALEFRRDVVLPRELIYNSELRGILTEFSTRGAEQARVADGLLNSLENSLKSAKRRVRGAGRPGDHPGAHRVGAGAARQGRRRPAAAGQYGAAWDNYRANDRAVPRLARPLPVHRGRAGFALGAFGHCPHLGAPPRRGDQARRAAAGRFHQRQSSCHAAVARVGRADLSRAGERSC